MNIMMMTNTYTPIMGGLERSIKAFTTEFRRHGHKVTIVVPEYKNRPKNERGVVRIPAIQKFNNTDFSMHIPIPGQLADLMEAFMPDLVHAHHPFFVGDMAVRLSGQYRIPLIFSYHTMFDQYTHYLPLNNEAARAFVTELSAGYANLADHVIAPSESVRDILRERGVAAPITVIPTGVNIKRFRKGNRKAARQILGLTDEIFVAGHVGRFAPEKNLDFLSRAAALFLSKNSNARFLVAGKGPSEECMLDIFRRYGVSDQVIWKGALEGQKLVDAYYAMDVFAFASKSETQGLVLTEAMAAGVPVVAMDAPGAREVVRDKINGRLLDEESEGPFAEALAWAAGVSESERAALREEALSTADSFSLDRMADRALEMYRSVRRRADAEKRDTHGVWSNMMGRIKTEWEMLANLSKATGAAVKEAVTSN